jgi:hypothetical protein
MCLYDAEYVSFFAAGHRGIFLMIFAATRSRSAPGNLRRDSLNLLKAVQSFPMFVWQADISSIASLS